MTRLFADNEMPQSVVLPGATRTRWQPIRGGLLNLYLYDYEEFRYEDGHLILRGNNGTGKSRVMALQLPFLFDGRLATHRVEPDADPSKRMDWNLLMGRHSERLGYTWVEFGKRTSVEGNGTPPSEEFVTLGCGLSATKSSGMREPWYFVTDQRIGEELFLQSDAGHALSKSALKEAIGERGQVYETGRDYRMAVDQALFGLGSQRYEAMVDLLVQLRKPQLSRHLDEKMLAGVLAEALPPPSEQMINDVAESFRSLESDRMELNRFQSACDGVDSFLRAFRRYARIAARRRADDVRTSHNRYEYASKALRKAESENHAATSALQAASKNLQALEVDIEAIVTRLKTLNSDPKMRSAEAIQQALEREQQATADLESAKQEAEAANKKVAIRRAARKSAFDNAEVKLKEARGLAKKSRQLADSCALVDSHDAAFAPLKLDLSGDDPSLEISTESIRTTVSEATSLRNRACEQLSKRNEALRLAEDELRRSQESRDNAQSAVDTSIEEQATAENRRQSEVDSLLQAYEMWRRDSDELSLPSPDEIAETLDDWSLRPETTNPISVALSQAELRAKEKVSQERIRLEQQADELSVEHHSLAERIEKLEHGFHEPPELPPLTLTDSRTERAGAPFWSLVDFQPSCRVEDRANVEAALTSAGILNAWVTPDGKVLGGQFEDVLLTFGEAQDAPIDKSLVTVLQPSPDSVDGEVDQRIVQSVLRRIGAGPQNGTTWVDLDGHWQNGPLRGHASKAAPQFIGHEAREQNRLRQLEEVSDELRRVNAEIDRIQGALNSLKIREDLIKKQVAAVPDDASVREAASDILHAERRTTDCRRTLAEAVDGVARHKLEANAQKEARDADARDLGLADWADRIEEMRQKLAQYQMCLEGLWPSVAHFATLRSQFVAAAREVRDAKVAAKGMAGIQHDRETQYAKAAARLRTLRETIGVEAEEILAQIAETEKEQSELKSSIKRARETESSAGREVAKTEERILARRSEIDNESAARSKSCQSFQRLCTLGLLGVATGDAPDSEASQWSVSKTVEVARRTETTFSQVNADDGAWDRVQQSVNNTIQELNTALSQHAFTSTLTTTDGLYLVTVPYQGKDRSIHELRDLLAEEVDQRRLVLDEREREIIENHLIGEVATQLHEQIHQAIELVDKMNAEIQKRPMSTGMMLKFDWKPDESLSSGIVAMCKKLLGSTAAWSPDERSAIGRYLQDHIKDVRAAREAGAWHEHLAEALDYRRWHRFWVMRKQDTGWKKLTKKTHGTGSGGEKAVALTIPQFAAAAAHYESARSDAPRLILLDEAFVGVDPDMRGKCMELINVFDLDFLLTSESEWGCYASLPGVAIYQLSTRTGFDAVFVTRWVWNGKQKVRQQNVLPSAARQME